MFSHRCSQYPLPLAGEGQGEGLVEHGRWLARLGAPVPSPSLSRERERGRAWQGRAGVALQLVLLPVVLVAWLASAGAQPVYPDCGDNPTCHSLCQQARAQSVIGRLDEAFRLYTRAYEVEADPDLLFNIARVLHKQGNETAAARYYRKFLDSPSQAAPQRHKAQAYLQELQPGKLRRDPGAPTP